MLAPWFQPAGGDLMKSVAQENSILRLPDRGATSHVCPTAMVITSARSTEMRKQIVFLLAETTEMRMQMDKMRKQIVHLLAETTEMSQQIAKMRKQIVFSLIKFSGSCNLKPIGFHKGSTQPTELDLLYE